MSTFDKYRKRGDYHWKEYKRPSVYREYVKGLPGWVTGKEILDVGAGDGLISYVLGARGVELDPIAVDLAQKHGVDVIQGDATDLPFPEASFDTVFMGDVIEHLEQPRLAVKEALRVLRPGGLFFVTTPPERVPPREHHHREYTPETLRDAVESVGFTLRPPIFTRHERIHAAFTRW